MRREFDVFFSFSKMKLDGEVPSDTQLYQNLFDQIIAADSLGFKTAWVGEAHFSIKPEQKKRPPLLPHFDGELCINPDILQIAHVIYPKTQQIEIGSAIRNILVNGGPIAHAESILNFLTINNQLLNDTGRKLNIGFGVGRFQYANSVYGIRPRNSIEEFAWNPLRGLILKEAAEIFIRLLRGEIIGSKDIVPIKLDASRFRTKEEWVAFCDIANIDVASKGYPVDPFWQFEPVKLIPEEVGIKNLNLVLGSHDKDLQVFVNQLHPVKVFNLSITDNDAINATHERMRKAFHPSGGEWQRRYMPRTVMVFVNADPNLSPARQSEVATEEARNAIEAYTSAMEGTVDEVKVATGMENAVYGNAVDVKNQIESRFDKHDRLMTWFDFNTNDKNIVIKRMTDFVDHAAPLLNQ
jgi:alkanesulfonate monooxygenase SsuD/methylene tetrahydromethanopterin reductase-like flavin-dependent oxidoreductase (luciferase family)